MIPLETLEQSLFAPLIGQVFLLMRGEAPEPLKLVEAETLGHRRPDARHDPFALRFKGAPGLRVPQGIHRLRHEGLGEMEFFLAQNGDGPAGSEFEAIFN